MVNLSSPSSFLLILLAYHNLFIEVFCFIHHGTFLFRKERKCHHRHHYAEDFFRLRSQQLNLLVNELESDFPSTEKQTELWLDLRGTAIHPQAAVEYIMKQLDQINNKNGGDDDTSDYDYLPSFPPLPPPNSLVDKVIVSDDFFQKLVNSLDPYTQLEDILYVPNESGNLVALSRNGVSIPFGSLISVKRDATVAVTNPIDALQDISKGNWILLVGEDDKPETWKQLEAMGNFLEVASSASSSLGGTMELESGLLVQAERDYESSGGSSEAPTGGVAIKCSSRASVLQLASIFQSVQSTGATTTTTKSGILIQQTPEKTSPILPTAMILPFDVNLWEAASLLYGEDQFVLEEEEDEEQE